MSNALDLEKYLAFQVLEYVLLDAPGAPLKQALLDAGIGVDIYGGFEDGILQPSFEVTTKGARQEQREVFVETIEATLRKLAEEGLQKRSLLAGLDVYKRQLKMRPSLTLFRKYLKNSFLMRILPLSDAQKM